MAQAISLELAWLGSQRFQLIQLIARDAAHNQELVTAQRDSLGAAVSTEQTDLIDEASSQGGCRSRRPTTAACCPG